MNETFKIVAGGREFQSAVKMLKKRGGSFDASTKTWAVAAGVIDETDLRLWGIEKVSPAPEYDAGLGVDLEPEHYLGV